MSAPLHTTTPSRGTLGKRLLTTFCVVLTLTLLGSVIGIWSLRETLLVWAICGWKVWLAPTSLS